VTRLVNAMSSTLCVQWATVSATTITSSETTLAVCTQSSIISLFFQTLFRTQNIFCCNHKRSENFRAVSLPLHSLRPLPFSRPLVIPTFEDTAIGLCAVLMKFPAGARFTKKILGKFLSLV